jgi:signal transduction histidine kinase
VRDLHDGVGGLATNIRMLAELGMRSTDRAGRALQSIFDLSGRTVGELRAFMQALDDSGRDWPSLAVEARRMAAQMVEAQDRALRMQTHVDPAAPAPSAPMALNVLRIFREALTNALKHSAATEVSVDLCVEAHVLHLRVENALTARSETDAELNSGRGVANMEARARELGGTAELVTAGDRVVLTVSVPLPRNTPGADAPAHTAAG